uniref:Uncharacterized protein n=2 Tax=Onchocerca TaxID=6281 RepID=A0A8R1XWU2_ONCVO
MIETLSDWQLFGTEKHSSIMSLTSFYHSFSIFFIINEGFVWADSNSYFDERTVLSSDTNDNTVSNGIIMKRVHRDVGILSTPLVGAFVTGIIGREERQVRVKKDVEPILGAVLHGIIGMTSKAVADLTTYRPYLSDGGCEWFGTAPFCKGYCQAEYDYIRNSNGRCSNWWFAGVCKPDPSFGEPCSTVFGGNFKKFFCCKSDPSECTWSGRWMGAFTAHNIYCRYDNHDRCGHLECSINHFNFHAHNSTVINGDRCDRISLFGLNGKATCGYIAWFDQSGTLVDSWYKSR